MDVRIKYLPSGVNEWDVTRAVAKILHSEEFAPISDDERLINFKVKLNPSLAGGVRNDGTGTLTLPTTNVGNKFLNFVRDTPIKLEGKKVKFYKQEREPPKWLALTLDKTPYIDPNIEEERQQKLWDLQDQLRVDAVQVGIFYRPSYPAKDREPLKPRAFAIEWEKTYVQESIGWLKFEYDHKLIRIKLGNEMTEQIGSSLAISFASIQKIGVGNDPKPYICFDTLTPPIMEEIEFHRTLTGDDAIDNRKYKHRIGSLHPGHATVAPYAPHVRIVLFKDPNIDMVGNFVKMCITAGLAENMILRCHGSFDIETHRRSFFSSKRLYELQKILRAIPWQVAFQLEALLHNCLLHTEDVLALMKPIHELCSRQPPVYVGDLLRRYSERLLNRSPRESPMKCFEAVRGTFDFLDSPLPAGTFRCFHVTFTPTRMILEGPYATQSNRVIRQYRGYEVNFIRVDFRDEDRLQYRWDKEVDGTSFLRERVGGILKGGFQLAGRQFEFLAYSSSALREHAVWFMTPFSHPDFGWVTSAFIRNSLGDFTKLAKNPSKYAARLAQAFTATDPSVEISRAEWEEVEDLGSEPYLHTDGVGTISRSLGNRMWEALTSQRRDHGANSIQPSAYQIRFLGFKGVVAVDEQLDNNANGIQMRLRPSMNKFEVSQLDIANIEVAQAFENPGPCYLNRPLVMILEDLEVRREAFIELQDIAIADARTIDESSPRFRAVLDSHSLGRQFRLPTLLKRLEDLGFDLHPQKFKPKFDNPDQLTLGIDSSHQATPGIDTFHQATPVVSKPRQSTPGIDNPFLRQLRQVAMADVLRDIKHNARIPIPDSYLLVGVADEGPAYQAAGHHNVFTLKQGHIFVCIQRPGDPEPTWLEGSCSLSRSPVVHPGDIQRVRAIGKPPEGMLCLFAHMKNVVVLPSVGRRSLASMLGGGDLDGDQFAVIHYSPLLPPSHSEPAAYPAGKTLTLDRESTVEDVCDFIVEYLNSDVLGLLSDRLLVIADQSKDGIFDDKCAALAELCSQAVDYPKQGIPVDLDNNKLPSTLIRCKPDWHAAEVVSPRHTDYYESNRALGHMFRGVTVDEEVAPMPNTSPPQESLSDPISLMLKERVQRQLNPYSDPTGTSPETIAMFRRYADELSYICVTHTLSNTPGVRLLESEVVVGTILAKCSQKRWRKDRMYRMRLHASTLVRDVQRQLVERMDEASVQEVEAGLELAWSAWDLSLRRRNEFGANSFGLVALGVIFDCLDRLAIGDLRLDTPLNEP